MASYGPRTASDIDYAGLYASEYYGHASGVTSFRPRLAAIIRSLSAELGINTVVDAGAGNAELAAQLRNLGMQVFSVDIKEDIERGVIGFDLTGADKAARDALRALVRERIGHAQYLVTCLDLLEHIGPDDLGNALATLQALTGRWLLASISTRPSSDHNSYHATVAPVSNWIVLLQSIGFERREYPIFREVSSPLPDLEGERNWAVNHWREMNPYREASEPEPNYALLEMTSCSEPTRDKIWNAIGPRMNEWSVPEIDPEIRWTFLIGHVQDFSAYVPFWSVLPKENVRVILRRSADGLIGERHAASLVAWLRSRGIRSAEIAKTSDWAWEFDHKQVFVSHSESNIAISHMLNSAFTSVARYYGYKTFLLQHGLWMEESAQPVAFASEHLLSWGEQHRTFFEEDSVHFINSHRMPRALLADIQIGITGCPKFDVYAAKKHPTMAQILGEWTRKYRRRIVCTTNLHWTEHKVDPQSFRTRLADVARIYSEDLFIVKLHPTEPYPTELVQSSPENMVVVDEFFCWWAGIKTADLIRAADLALSTKSTTMLEIALAKKPCLVFNTGNRIHYEGVTVSNSDKLVEALASPENAYDNTFVRRFYDTATLGCGLSNAIAFISKKVRSHNFLSLSAARAICYQKAVGEHLTWYVEECRQLRRPDV